MVEANESFQLGDLGALLFDLRSLLFKPALLPFDLLLLLFDGVDEHDRDAVILDAFDFASRVARHQQRLDLLDRFGAQAEVAHAALLPGEAHRLQAVDD